MRRLLNSLALIAAIHSGGAQAQDFVALTPTPDDSYTPLFLMYSGDPSPAKLQGLQQFLKANNASQEVAQDTLESVVFKLKNYKAGFAYPIYFSETAKTGNACVVADGHSATPSRAISAMTTPRLLRTVLGNQAPHLDEVAMQDSVFQHELFHCYDLMRQSQTEVGTQIARDGANYFAYWSETGADAYAALIAIRNGGDKRALRQIRDFRTLNLLNGDSAHYTARTLDYILSSFDHARLNSLNARQLLQLAYAVRVQTAFTPGEFRRLEAAAGAFEKQFKVATGGDTHPNTGWVQNLIYSEPEADDDPEYFSQLILQVRLALYNLGGDISTSNASFYPVLKKFYLPVLIRSAQADLAH